VQALLSIGVRLTDDSFVVAQADGSPVQPNTLTHNWVIECAKIGLPRIRFHDMRHTQPICWQVASTPKSPASVWVTARRG
jgi:integrase